MAYYLPAALIMRSDDVISISFVFFFTDTPTPQVYTLSLHDALPISPRGNCFGRAGAGDAVPRRAAQARAGRSEEHTSELQSRRDLVCRLLLEKKKKHAQALGRRARLDASANARSSCSLLSSCDRDLG